MTKASTRSCAASSKKEEKLVFIVMKMLVASLTSLRKGRALTSTSVGPSAPMAQMLTT